MNKPPIKDAEKSKDAYSFAVEYVTAERAELTRVGKELTRLISTYNSESEEDRILFKHHLLEISQRLGNIAGYCDTNGRQLIILFNQTLSQYMVRPEKSVILLEFELPYIIGIQVDFTKAPPFKIISGSLEVLGQKLKGKLGR